MARAGGGGIAPARDFNGYTLTSCNKYLVFQGGIISTLLDSKASGDIHTFQLETSDIIVDINYNVLIYREFAIMTF